MGEGDGITRGRRPFAFEAALTALFALLSFSCRDGNTSSGPTPTADESPSSASDADVAPSHEGASHDYDLDADIRARITVVRREFDAADLPIHVESGVFVMFGFASRPIFDASVKIAHDAIAAYLNDRFARLPARAVSVYVFASGEPYADYCASHIGPACNSTLGFYVKDTREILVNQGPGITTLTHELVHPIVEDDFPGAPAWLNEGLSSLYERPALTSDGRIHGKKNFRLEALRPALASHKRGARLDALFGMTNEEFRSGEVELHVALARFACLWLDAREELWPFYHAWRDAVGDDATGEKAFAKAVGETPAQANAEWVKWVTSL